MAISSRESGAETRPDGDQEAPFTYSSVSQPDDPTAHPHHIVKVDFEHPADHLDIADDRSGLIGTSPTGEFTVECLFLNRSDRMKRIIELRMERAYCDKAIAHGLRVLCRARIDDLPQRERVGIVRTRETAMRKLTEMERLLEELCASPIPRRMPDRAKRHRARDQYLQSVGVQRVRATRVRKQGKR